MKLAPVLSRITLKSVSASFLLMRTGSHRAGLGEKRGEETKTNKPIHNNSNKQTKNIPRLLERRRKLERNWAVPQIHATLCPSGWFPMVTQHSNTTEVSDVNNIAKVQPCFRMWRAPSFSETQLSTAQRTGQDVIFYLHSQRCLQITDHVNAILFLNTPLNVFNRHE